MDFWGEGRWQEEAAERGNAAGVELEWREVKGERGRSGGRQVAGEREGELERGLRRQEGAVKKENGE